MISTRWGTWVIVMLAWMAVPVAGESSGSIVADVTAGSLAAGGEVNMEMALAAYVESGSHEPISMMRTFELDAATMRVEAINWVGINTVGLGSPPIGEPERNITHYTQATLKGEGARPMSTLTIQPLFEDFPVLLSVESPCAHVNASQRDEVAPTQGPDTVASRAIPISNAIKATPCQGTMEVEGSFRLSIWEWNIVTEGQGKKALQHRTGQQHKWIIPPSFSGGGVGTVEYHQLYVDVTDAHLRIEMVPNAAIELYGRETTMTVGGEVSLQNVRGRTQQDGSWVLVDQPMLNLSGPLYIQLEVNEDSSETFRAIAADQVGSNFSPSMTTLGGMGQLGMENLVLIILALIAGSAMLFLTRRGSRLVRRQLRRHRDHPKRAAHLRQRASHLQARGHHIRAAWSATHAIRLDPSHADGFVVRALARASQGRYEAALRDHVRAHHRLQDEKSKALNAFEAARVHGLRRDPAEAAYWLTIAIRCDSKLLQEALLEPDFAPVASDPVFRRMVRDVIPGASLAGP